MVRGGVHADGGVCVVKGGMHGEGGMHGRGHAWWRGMHGRGDAWWRGHVWWSGSMCGIGGCVWQRGGACVAGETATVAGGTHPTGMHSCVCHFRGSHTSFLRPFYAYWGFSTVKHWIQFRGILQACHWINNFFSILYQILFCTIRKTCDYLRPVYTYLLRLHHRQSLPLCQWKWSVWWIEWVLPIGTMLHFDGDRNGDGTCKQAFTVVFQMSIFFIWT